MCTTIIKSSVFAQMILVLENDTYGIVYSSGEAGRS